MRFDLRLPSAAEWAKVFEPKDATLLVPCKAQVAVGEAVRIDVCVGDAEGPQVTLRGQVAANREQGGVNHIVVAVGSGDKDKINYLNAYVRGGLLNLRAAKRLPIRLKVVYGGVAGSVDTECKDIGEEGIFLITDAPLPEGSILHMVVHFPGGQPMQLKGKVSHTVLVEDEDLPGMGVVFDMNGEETRALVRAIESLEGAYLAGTLAAPTVK